MNPALTLAFAAAKRLPWKKVPVYWTAQVLGAFVASACVYGVYYGERKGIIWWIDCCHLSSTFVPFVGIFINVFFLKFLNYILFPLSKLNRCLEWIRWWCSSRSWSKRHGRDLGDLSSVLLINRKWLRWSGKYERRNRGSWKVWKGESLLTSMFTFLLISIEINQ